MMRKAVAGFWLSPASEGVSALVVTAAFFAIGGVLGGFFSSCSMDGGGEMVSSYLEGFLSAARQEGLLYPDLLQFLWLSLRWPLFGFALGFSALGLLAIPLLSGLRGFLFSFSVGVFVRALGRRGLGSAFLLLGMSGLISIPVFLLVVTQSFIAARGLISVGPGKREASDHRAFLLRCSVSLLLLLVGLVLEWYFVPVLLSGRYAALY